MESLSPARPSVAILLATYNGGRFLREQLESFSNQSLRPASLICSDDGSTDSTLSVFDDWLKNNTDISAIRINGPRQGFAANFRQLIVSEPGETPFVAFSDQDDVWMPEKLAIATTELAKCDLDVPALYCGRTLNFPAVNGHEMSPHFKKPASFQNALVQSIAGGNTMVLNRCAFELLREAAKRTGFVSHDWWCYQLVSGAGGKVIYDPEPLVKYRQHEGNLVGSNNGFAARMERFKMLLSGRFRRWTDANLDALVRCEDLLTEENQNLVREFVLARNRGGWTCARFVRNHGLYRQTLVGHIGLHVAAALRLL